MESAFVTSLLIVASLLLLLASGVWIFASMLVISIGGLFILNDYSFLRIGALMTSVQWRAMTSFELGSGVSATGAHAMADGSSGGGQGRKWTMWTCSDLSLLTAPQKHGGCLKT